VCGDEREAQEKIEENSSRKYEEEIILTFRDFVMCIFIHDFYVLLSFTQSKQDGFFQKMFSFFLSFLDL
jgi:hypothetical protein